MVKIMLQNSVPFSFIYGNPLSLKLSGPQSPKQVGDIVRSRETWTTIHASNSGQRQGGAEEGRPVLFQPQGHSTKRLFSTFCVCRSGIVVMPARGYIWRWQCYVSGSTFHSNMLSDKCKLTTKYCLHSVLLRVLTSVCAAPNCWHLCVQHPTAGNRQTLLLHHNPKQRWLWPILEQGVRQVLPHPPHCDLSRSNRSTRFFLTHPTNHTWLLVTSGCSLFSSKAFWKQLFYWSKTCKKLWNPRRTPYLCQSTWLSWLLV